MPEPPPGVVAEFEAALEEEAAAYEREVLAALGAAGRSRHAAHDVSGEPRDPEGKWTAGGGGSGKRPEWARRKPKEGDAVHSYLGAFQEPGEGEPATAKDARQANRELKEEGSAYRIVPDGQGGWVAAHRADLADNYGPRWTVAEDPLTGRADVAEPDYFHGRQALAGDRLSRSYVQAFNDPAADKPATAEEAAQANRELEADGSAYRLKHSEEHGAWVAVPAAVLHRRLDPDGGTD